MLRPHACGGRTSELDPRVLREDQLDILRIMILPRDEQDFLDPAGDDQFAIAQRSQVAGIGEAVGRARLRRELRIDVVAGRHVVAADQDAANRFRRDRVAKLVGNAQFASFDGAPDAHELDGVVARRSPPCE